MRTNKDVISKHKIVQVLPADGWEAVFSMRDKDTLEFTKETYCLDIVSFALIEETPFDDDPFRFVAPMVIHEQMFIEPVINEDSLLEIRKKK